MEERLQKFMAKCGVASRRKCEEFILQGKVKVNNNIITELGYKVNENDTVKYNDEIINLEENKVYLMLNKPEGYVATVSDEKGRQTILDIVKVKERVYPIGRLDYDSSGLILLTNDGDIYNKIIHPRQELNKKYIVECFGEFTDTDIKKFKSGVDIGGYTTAPANIEVISVERKKNIISTVEITIHEGKNRQIRKMCSALNHEVLSLKRVSVGELKLSFLKKGDYRDLTHEEVNYIKNL